MNAVGSFAGGRQDLLVTQAPQALLPPPSSVGTSGLASRAVTLPDGHKPDSTTSEATVGVDPFAARSTPASLCPAARPRHHGEVCSGRRLLVEALGAPGNLLGSVLSLGFTFAMVHGVLHLRLLDSTPVYDVGSANVIEQMSRDMAGMTYAVPWTMIGLVAAIAYAASLLTTFLPARRRRSTRRRRYE